MKEYSAQDYQNNIFYRIRKFFNKKEIINYMKTHTFKTEDTLIDGDPNTLTTYEFTVSDTFLSKVSNPETITPHVLFSKHRMQDYLHCEDGPAAKLLVLAVNKDKNRDSRDSRLVAQRENIPGYEEGIAHFGEYWLNGKRVSPEKEAEMLKAYIERLKKEGTK